MKLLPSLQPCPASGEGVTLGLLRSVKLVDAGWSDEEAEAEIER